MTVTAADAGALVSCRVVNRGRNPAFGVTAELWGSGEPPRDVADELGRDGAAVISWWVPRERWRRSLRQMAAVRVHYRDAGHAWASTVSVHGRLGRPEVRAPRWPQDPRVQLTWREPPARGGRVVWWSPSGLAVNGDGRWAAGEGGLTISGTFRPVRDVTGWETSVFALLLPDVQEAPGLLVRVPFDARSFRSLWRPDARLLAAYTLLCALAWGLAATRRRRSPPRARGYAGELLVSLPALTAALFMGAVLLTIFPPGLLTLDTTPAGGDFASQVVALRHLREELLPNGRVYGWSHEQYAGFPLFVFYFPLAFLVVVLVSLVTPLTVALKLGSLLGPVLLAPAWWLTLRWLGPPLAARWCAPGAALAFLLIEEQSVWGGNLASLLAGKFAYALGYPLAWLAMGQAWKTRDRSSGWWPVPVLLALTGLAHGYTLLCAAVGVLLLGMHPRLWWRRWWHVGRSGILAFGLLAWWLLPLLWNLPLDERLPRALGAHGSRSAAAPRGLAGVCAPRGGGRAAPGAAAITPPRRPRLAGRVHGSPVRGVRARLQPGRGRRPFPADAARALLLAGCWELGLLIELARPRLRPALAAAAVATASCLAAAGVEYVPAWARWNLSGMERKARWRDYAGVMRHVAGAVGDPRVAFEHHP
ncbi:MAG: hypothetical protein ABR599_04530, partial [Gemmatimonadota bacterium]